MVGESRFIFSFGEVLGIFHGKSPLSHRQMRCLAWPAVQAAFAVGAGCVAWRSAASAVGDGGLRCFFQ
jgi:hypothetical protein